MRWEAFDEIRTPQGWLEQARTLKTKDCPNRSIRSRISKMALAVACLCFMVVGTAFAAEILWGVPVSIFRPDETDSGYYIIETDVKHLTPDEYSGQIRAALAALDPDDPNSGNNLYQDSWADCADFLGIPLLMHPWMDMEFDWSNSGHDLTPDENVPNPFRTDIMEEDGHLLFADAHAFRRIDGIEFSLSATVYGEMDSSLPSTQQGESWDQAYTMSCGLNARILTFEEDCLTLTYFATEHVQYQLISTCGPEGAELVREFLDGFYATGDFSR